MEDKECILCPKQSSNLPPSNVMMSANGEKCTCEKGETTQESDSSTSESSSPRDKKTKISLTSLGLNLRRGRSLQFKSKRSKKTSNSSGDSSENSSTSPPGPKKSPKWALKFYCGKKETKSERPETQSCCKCTCYRRTEERRSSDEGVYSNESVPVNEEHLLADVVSDDVPVISNVESTNEVAEVNAETPPVNAAVATEDIPEIVKSSCPGRSSAHIFLTPPFFDLQWMRVIHEDSEEAARLQRAREIEQGVDPPASFRPPRRVQLLCSDVESEGQAPRRLQLVCPSDLTVDSLRALFQTHVTFRSCPLDVITGCHTQVDFIHCLVPDLLDITNCSFYWGKMDRYEAERLLDGKREGTFLLRDSAQEEFLFSVSFRKYGRSLHARIEQWNHKFSFDSHDPGVYTSDTVCGLIEHYKDPSSCMFFEPMLTWPLHRNFVFPLQHLCRATIVSRLTYDNVNQLQLPKTLKSYLKEYHYRQKVRVERFEDDVPWVDLRNVPS